LTFHPEGKFDLGTTQPKPTEAKPASTSASTPVYNAKNPHPNNPWNVKTHRTEFVRYNSGTSAERGQSMKRFKAMGTK